MNKLCPQKWRSSLFLRTFFLSFMPYRIWRRVSRLESGKNRFLVIWYTPSSLSSFMTCPSFQRSIAVHIMWSLHTLFMPFCCCTSPKIIVQIQAVGHERKKNRSSKTRTVFIFEDAIVCDYDYLGFCRWSWFTHYRPAPLLMSDIMKRTLTFLKLL